MHHLAYRGAALAGALSLVFSLTAVGTALAQHISRWVDDRGVVHFSSSPPPPGVAFESIKMAAESKKRVSRAPAETVSGMQEGAAPSGANEAAKDAAKGDDAEERPAASGPPQLVAKLKDTPSGGSARELAGTVKNVGGATAGNVSVSVTVFEDGQGNECLHEEIAVDPSTLDPGQVGNFSASFDDPCFFGEPRIDIVAEWR